MKLTKFELEKMEIKEMSAIRAGSGVTYCGVAGSICQNHDTCNYGGDKCG